MDPGYSYFVVRFFLFLQSVFDILLDLTVGYSTKEGWRKERERSKQDYEASAQLVRHMVSNFINFLYFIFDFLS